MQKRIIWFRPIAMATRLKRAVAMMRGRQDGFAANRGFRGLPPAGWRLGYVLLISPFQLAYLESLFVSASSPGEKYETAIRINLLLCIVVLADGIFRRPS